MSRKKKVLVAIVIALIGAAAIAANLYFRRETGVEVTVEEIRARDLEAIVSASGKIQPQRQVNISANTMGRVTRVAVEEGQQVRQGQFLLEIDPRSLEGQLARGEASVAAARSALDLARTNVEQTRVTLELSRQNLRRQEELWRDGLTTREALERAQNEVAVRETELKAREQEIRTREEQIKQEEASLATTRYNLSQVIINAPMDGIVTRRNIEEGETAVVGTMNNAGTVLLTIADMSVIEAEVEVDETDIPSVAIGQEARVTIDAVPNRTFLGRVTEIGNSPTQVQQAGQANANQQATSFLVTITLEDEVPNVRPGFTCTATIITATRQQVTAVPIQSLTIREMLFDEEGELVHEPPPPRGRFSFGGANRQNAQVSVVEPPPGYSRRETEGVFAVRDNRAVFTPVKVGVAGERYFEVLEGLSPGDRVVTGPFASVRELPDGAEIRIQAPPRTTGVPQR